MKKDFRDGMDLAVGILRQGHFLCLFTMKIIYNYIAR